MVQAIRIVDIGFLFYWIALLARFNSLVTNPRGWVIGINEVYHIACFVEAGKMGHLSGSFLGRAAIDSCQLLADLIRDVTST